VEAIAPDTTIEAISLTGPSFALGLQWHPEFTTTCPISNAIFQAFGRALANPLSERLAAD
jgi:putative glutamine amidotransferase